ncbi:TonB-dependent receptor plug domain-containing protein [Chryseobacterium balustinum]|uniref:Iron complex outermembrane recepter protein n=1 Tax=Chryseobacterium balustinum TaxID=246 RepID=A0AAX2IFF1_9FLAO|nr:TonB-dependent receptor [Chryseobacterium balustinum]AZB28547.1 TonB-dependent receptor [Chryseobacterium balustinum]SKB77084.1 iron complex outermembrane recepter protein [Chryseobacterium balustinum]SQA86622.1 Outer membrane cobalamin translocator [Chryseobacterium balustinum]
MILKRALTLLSVSSCLTIYYSQEKNIDTVFVFDSQMKKVKLFHSLTTLSPADIQKNSSNLSEVLRFQSPVYIKENGRGAVSSPSFRGTTAQQTAFVWNGININSQFLGQGDVNNIALFGYDQMEIKSGGGSVIYGSGAIGGSIHLNNDLSFNKGFNGLFNSEIASFGTYNNSAKAAFSNDKFSFKVSGNYLISENDYEVPEENYINRNGKFYNSTLNIGTSYKIADNQTISWQSQFYDATQNYRILEENLNKTSYEAQTFRSLVSWDINKSKVSNSLKAAYTEDNFQYFGIYNAPFTSGGINKNYILKNDFNYFIIPKLNINVIGEFQQNQGEGLGSSELKNVSRNVGSVAGLLRYFATQDLRFEAGIRQNFIEDISSPLLYSFSGKWKANNWYQINLNLSKNFRHPSFNDLYWEPGGNLNLKSETSIQADLNQEFSLHGFKLSITPYYIKIDNMIRWLPTAFGYWAAFNTEKVESYGLESQLSYQKRFNENHSIKLIAGYTYTKSVDLKIQKQLMYVPLHKFTSNVDYQYKFLNVFAQGMFNGLTYTTSDESKKDAIYPYFVMNAGISATIFKKYTLGIKMNNITDTVYETTAYYPLPKRNYSINATINF